MSNTATDIAVFIPAKYRKVAYAVLALVGLALGATTVGFVAVAATLPKWLVAAQAVFGFVSAATGFVARANVAPETPVKAP